MPGIFHSVELQRRALDYHVERHNVLASNVANVDTPGFRPLELLRTDVSEEPAANVAPAATLAATAQDHYITETTLLGRDDSGPPSMEVLEDRTAPVGADGNAVSLEREMAKLSANDLRFEGAAKIVAAQLAGLRYAASDFNNAG